MVEMPYQLKGVNGGYDYVVLLCWTLLWDGCELDGDTARSSMPIICCFFVLCLCVTLVCKSCWLASQVWAELEASRGIGVAAASMCPGSGPWQHPCD